MATTTVRPPASQFSPVPRRFWAPGLELFDVLGQIVLFAVAALRQVPRAFSSRRYRGEIWWYAAFLAIGSTPVALIMTYFSGSECSVEAYYSLHQLGGAESLAGVFNALCDMREITPLFFGFALGAKIVWLPTVHSRQDIHKRPVPSARHGGGIAVIDEHGAPLPVVREIFAMVRERKACRRGFAIRALHHRPCR